MQEPLKISSVESLDAGIAEVVRLQIKYTETIARMETEKAGIEKCYAGKIGNLLDFIKQGEVEVQLYCQAHRAELFADKKSRDTLTAVVGFEFTPWRVEKSSRKIKWEDIVKRLKRLRWGKAYVRQPDAQCDKESLLQDREKLTVLQKLAAGIGFARDEQFFIRPKSPAAENTTKEA